MYRRTVSRPAVRRTMVAGLVVLLVVGLLALLAARRAPPPVAPAFLTVSHLGLMPFDRAAHQATRLRDGRVLITGGCVGPGCTQYLDRVHAYDAERDVFSRLPSMGSARAGHTATLLAGGRVLVVGGWDGDGPVTSAELYDPDTGRWSNTGSMQAPRTDHAAVALADERVLIAGGTGAGNAPLLSAEIYDGATGHFRSLDPMHGSRAVATRLDDGRVLLTGGLESDGMVSRTAELFDPATERFTLTAAMTRTRTKHASVLLPDGRVLVVGGSDARGYGGRLVATEVYDPHTGAFRPGPDMHTRRHKIRDALAVLASGVVVVAGGAARPEVYDPATDAFYPVQGELDGALMSATATTLGDGAVLLLGGYDERTGTSSMAWLLHAR